MSLHVFFVYVFANLSNMFQNISVHFVLVGTGTVFVPLRFVITKLYV